MPLNKETKPNQTKPSFFSPTKKKKKKKISPATSVHSSFYRIQTWT